MIFYKKKLVLFCMFIIMLYSFLPKVLAECYLKEKNGIYTLGNNFIKLTIQPDKGGSVSSFEYLTASAEFNQNGNLSLGDMIYSQYKRENNKTDIYTECLQKRNFAAKILKNTPQEVVLELKVYGGSKEFEWLELTKTFRLKERKAAFEVDYTLSNKAQSDKHVGIRTKTFFRRKGYFDEKNVFTIPTSKGIMEIVQPGNKAHGNGDWFLSPAAGWEAVSGLRDGTGVLWQVDNQFLSCFFNWYRDSGFLSTMECFLREQLISPSASFKTSYKLSPFTGMKRIDAVLTGNIACGITLDGKAYFLSPTSGNIKVKLNNNPPVELKLEASKATVLKFKESKNKKIEFSVSQNGKFLGKVSRNSDSSVNIKKMPERIGKECLYSVYCAKSEVRKTGRFSVHRLASVKQQNSETGKHIDITALRQFKDSIAEAYISPANMPEAEKGISVIEIDEMGNPQSNVATVLIKDNSGSALVLWKVKGLGGIPLHAKTENGVLYDRKKNNLGKIKQRYRILLGKQSPKTQNDNKAFINGANLITNSSFEREFKDFHKKYKGVISRDNTVFKFGKHSLKLNKKPSRKYTPVAFFGIVEEDRNYDISLWCRQNATGRSLVTFTLYFFNKNWEKIKNKKGKPWKLTFCSLESSFDWRNVSKVIKVPRGARFIKLSVSGRPEAGSLWIDDVIIKPQFIKSSNALEREKEKLIKTTYKTLDDIFAVSEKFVTSHVKWLKPKTGKKPEILWLTSLIYASDLNKRELVEVAQRMSMKYKFIPLLPKMLTPSKGVHGVNSGDTYATVLEPYIMMLLKNELSNGPKDVVVVQDLNFRGYTRHAGLRGGRSSEKQDVQKEFTKMLLDSVRKGSGLVFYNCQNIPEEIQNVMKTGHVATPENILILPVIRKVSKSQARAICKTAILGKGRIAVISPKSRLYSCVPKKRLYERALFYDYCVRNFPYKEYMYSPFIKAIRWVYDKKNELEIEAIKLSDKKLDIQLKVQKAGNYDLKLDYKDIYWHDEGKQTEKASLKKGLNNLQIKIPGSLGGGKHIVHCRVGRENKICDFASIAFDLPEICKIKDIVFNNKNKVYKIGEEIQAQIKLDGNYSGSDIICEVEDTHNRIVKRIIKSAKGSVTVAFKLQAPYTILYRLFVRVKKAGNVLSHKLVEFSHPFAYPPTDDLTAYIWGGYPQRMLRLKEVGFDSDVLPFRKRQTGRMAALCNMNIRPTSIGCGSILGVGSRSPYKSDSASSDPVRHPCLSNPTHWKKARPYIHEKMITNKNLYYGIRDYFMNDEFALGSSVCVSEYCLKNFRKYLKKNYSNLETLNKSWKSSFTSWDKIVPLSMKEISISKNNIAAWLDHRLFMNNVYAFTWLAQTKKYISEINPKAKVGVSGTDNPGYSFDWFKCMQNIDFLANYGGIQNDLIASFASKETVFGRWTGGYVPFNKPYEGSERGIFWEGLLRRNNAYMFFMGGKGATLGGDLSLPINMQFCVEEIKEAKNGTAKLILSAQKADENILILYSQSSLFCAIATIGKEFFSGAADSWKNLLNDLKYNFKFISSRELAKNGVNSKKYKVLILPATLSLSLAETVKISEFVKSGGTLIGDYGTGVFDEHGALSNNKEIQQIFGIARKSNTLNISACEEKIAPNKDFGIAGGVYITRYAENNINLTTAKAAADTGTSGAPALICNNWGKGKAILLNNLINGYSQIVLKGAGGEIAVELKGPEKIRLMTRKITLQLLKGSGVTPLFDMKTESGTRYSSMGVVFEDGKNKYLGILKTDSKPGLIDYKKGGVKINIDLPEAAHIYDIRKAEYYGKTSEIKTNLIPAVAKLYSLMPYKVSGIRISTDKKLYQAGETVKINIAVMAEAAKAQKHVIRLELISPEGRVVRPYSQNIKLNTGQKTVMLNTALNDVSGQWIISVRDVATGIKNKESFKLINNKTGD